MGSCYYCGTQVTLKEDDEGICPGCGKMLSYPCNSCGQWFNVEGKDGKTLPLCGVCGFYYCPNCGKCGPTCEKHNWRIKIKGILQRNGCIVCNQEKLLSNLIDYIELIKVGKKRRSCPFGVSISYAKGRIKSFYCRTKGYRKKYGDVDAFESKMKTLLDNPLGKEITIGDIRDAGTYGIEYRDALNFCVCNGYYITEERTAEDKKGKEYTYQAWIRTNELPCKYLDTTDMLIKECPSCKNRYEEEDEYCSVCSYKKGSRKGQPYEIHEHINPKDICQLNKGDFEDGESIN